jgi:hypothetical protein
MTVASGNNGSAEMAQASGSPTDENRLQQLLRLAKASTKMVLELEKATPASALIGIWECTAKDARAEYIRAATKITRRDRSQAWKIDLGYRSSIGREPIAPRGAWMPKAALN